VVKNLAVEADRGRFVHQAGVDGIAAGVEVTADDDDVTDVEAAHLRFGEGRGEGDFAAGEREAVHAESFSTGRSGSR
jgi:hypothetical protein